MEKMTHGGTKSLWLMRPLAKVDPGEVTEVHLRGEVRRGGGASDDALKDAQMKQN